MENAILFILYGIICFGVGFYIRPRVDLFIAKITAGIRRLIGPKVVRGKATRPKPIRTPEELEIKFVKLYKVNDYDFKIIEKPPIDDYRREYFDPGTTTRINKQWSAREQVLIRDSIVQVTVRDGKIIAGQWRCPYTGQVFLNPADVDVDHIVPLAESWISGAKLWDQSRRSQFSRDLDNLIAVSQQANQQKGMKGPDKWMPKLALTDRATQIWYIARWIYTKQKYDLGLSQEELLAIAKFTQ